MQKHKEKEHSQYCRQWICHHRNQSSMRHRSEYMCTSLRSRLHSTSCSDYSRLETSFTRNCPNFNASRYGSHYAKKGSLHWVYYGVVGNVKESQRIVKWTSQVPQNLRYIDEDTNSLHKNHSIISLRPRLIPSHSKYAAWQSPPLFIRHASHSQ